MPPEAAPLLVLAMQSLRGDQEATVQCLERYCLLLTNRIFHERSNHQLSRLPLIQEANKEWSDLHVLFAQNATWTARLALPPFEAVWAEVAAFLQETSGSGVTDEEFDWYLIEEVDYYEIPLQRSVITVFEFLRSIPDISPWIDTIISAQPRVINPPSNAEFQKKAREAAGFDILPDLAHAIFYAFTQAAIEEYIGCFGTFVHSATTYFLSARRDVTQRIPDNELEPIVNAHRLRVSHPFSELSIWERQQLARVNIRGTFTLLLMDAVGLIMPGPHQCSLAELHWHMFKKYVDGVMYVANSHGPICVGKVRSALEHHNLEAFLDSTVQPNPYWTWDTFEDVLDFDEDDEFDPNDLDDVYFEPAGLEIKVERHAIAVTMASDLTEDDCSICRDTLNVTETKRDEIPIKTICGHCFHYGCLTTLVNGLSKFSNLCPNCRHEVCERREKRLKDGHQFNTYRAAFTVEPAAADGTADTAADLHDREGDVVMTDP